ncbi:stromal membrane-associated protein 1 isoform X5 [Anolis carolinensis]|uniref:stromal membrane-associated protein 1 isoform X5 n=1 Tax=Anolis carolinensis TaxID=28377 RepID=UPI00020383AF|nr:PREDICTED: stromal membrane-associated protein 1 isoform X4 [Anolis carolinensis]|eukprot:XP_003215549.1 PREDICTED: stromal membrane-associated protein 1 isoform X4 [Anolis carolinensis]
MATRSSREKAQKLNEQHQAILAKLLREEDNKYCADCEAKGPRWASWNTGVFICIRCAGIHRNLGVHISRVKSVNLDQWTPEQIQCMQEMGNTKARLLYEANLPENFRRPQTDQAVEFFIRDKYEKKKYYDKNAVQATTKEKEKKKEEKKKDREPEKPLKCLGVDKPLRKEDQQLELKASPKKVQEPTVDLLGLDGPADSSITNGSTVTPAAVLNDDLDIFGPMISNPLPATSAPPSQNASTNPVVSTLSAASGDLNLFTEQTKSEESAKKLLSKDSILSLYGTGTMPSQNAPGVFMGPQPLAFPTQPAAHFQGFPAMGVPVPVSVPAAPAMMGNMMGQSVPVMGQNTGMMVGGMGMPNGFSVPTQTAPLGLPQNVGGPQGTMVGQVVPPQKFGMQQTQPTQWNLSQMNQQMAGMNLSSSGNMMGFVQPPNTVAGWTGGSSGQTLSTQLWK